MNKSNVVSLPESTVLVRQRAADALVKDWVRVEALMDHKQRVSEYGKLRDRVRELADMYR